MLKSQIKTMFIIFFNIKGIIHFEYVSQGQAVNHAYYVEIMKQLCEAVCRRPELFSNNWTLPNDNAPAHKVLSVEQFLAQKWITENGTPTLIL
jgi:hypothetical protein